MIKMNMNTDFYGAVIERGKISTVSINGYTVESLDRQGITTPLITGIDDTNYTVGDIVLFFLFRDGTGKILCKA